MNKQELYDKLTRDMQKNVLPDDVIINTITIVCNVDINFNVGNIAKYIDMSMDTIKKVSHGRSGDNLTNRNLEFKKRIKPNNKNKKVFFNQVSLCVMVPSKKKKPVNLKLFSNGSIQMTGCKIIDNAIEALEVVFNELTKVKAIVDPKTLKIVEKPFCDKPDNLKLSSIKDISIAMIVSKFMFPVKINRPNLYNLFLQSGMECSYEPELHASVDLKYLSGEKKISVFIFEKGSIVITGARNCVQIKEAYDFVNNYLLTNHVVITRKNVTQNDIEKYLTADLSDDII
jgi:TATA-box binding protein (TBP) (component of TFIID and TFIIIB)